MKPGRYRRVLSSMAIGTGIAGTFLALVLFAPWGFIVAFGLLLVYLVGELARALWWD